MPTNVRVVYFSSVASADGCAAIRFYRKGVVTAIRWTLGILGHTSEPRTVQVQLNKSTANSLEVNDASGILSTVAMGVPPSGLGGPVGQILENNVAIPVQDGDVWTAHCRILNTANGASSISVGKFYVEIYVAE